MDRALNASLEFLSLYVSLWSKESINHVSQKLDKCRVCSPWRWNEQEQRVVKLSEHSYLWAPIGPPTQSNE